MIDYQIQAHTRRCAASGRELLPGDKYYSVLRDEGGKLVRLDYAADTWSGPPSGAFSFWAGRIPESTTKRSPRIDDELLMECFQRLQGDTEPRRVNFRYVVALLLMRRKRLRFEEIRREGDQELLLLRCPRTRSSHAVINPRLTEAEMDAVQTEVFQVLGWE
jgi:hypothetical protein